MGAELDLDDVASMSSRAKRELAELRARVAELEAWQRDVVLNAPTVAVKWAGVLYRPEETRAMMHVEGQQLIARPEVPRG